MFLYVVVWLKNMLFVVNMEFRSSVIFSLFWILSYLDYLLGYLLMTRTYLNNVHETLKVVNDLF